MLWILISILPLLANIQLASSSCRHEDNFGVFFIYCHGLNSLEEIDTSLFNTSMIRIYINSSSIALSKSLSLSGKRLKELQITRSNVSTIESKFLIEFQELDRITIQDSEIQKIDVCPHLKRLDSIIFERNKIPPLPNGFAYKLPKLNVMVMTESTIDSKILPGLMFKNVPLTELHLSGNGIVSMKSDTFNTLKKLEFLQLDNNSISVLPKKVFQDLETVVELNLNKNQIINLHKDVFIGLKNLKDLILSNNYLIRIERNWFDELPALSSLDLSSNRIKSMSIVSPSLKYLHMSKNLLTDLESELFIGVPSLKFLDISYNFVTQISSDAFKKLHNLQVLNLESNKISQIKGDVFKHFYNFTHFVLSGNKITDLSATQFNHLENLVSLNLSNNNLKKLPMSGFSKLYSLQELDLHNTRLTEIKPAMFTGLDNLKSLNLSNNTLTKIAPGVFKEVARLEILSLGNINVSDVDINSFSGLQHLRVLDLEYNKFTDLPVGLFSHFKLHYLSLKGNKVQRLNRNVFTNQTQMEEFDLRDTNIENLDMVEKMPKLRYLVLKDTKFENKSILRFKRQTFRKINEEYWDSWCPDFITKCKE